ncbi:hypothetical protein [Plebeiibacterium marinum]|uniref:Uncharacterized protein n=1 Tax=Plebeiibacterium marinum TaxID=2992111 RepID=A0AAE3MBB7_9BACT|nr:hypothetical protein [Plebeiobacterium marinum]MCW3804696.1 hypothetical protein [Plebeiobacterium marinum]
MQIIRLFFLLVFMNGLALQAQLKIEDLEEQAREISRLTDAYEKEYQLAEFTKVFKTFLKTYNDNTTLPDTAHIQVTRSSDSKYQVFYYNTYKDGVVYRLDWFVVYGSIYKKQVLHFHDKTFSHKDKRGNGAFRLHLSKLTEGTHDLYPLTFSFKADGKIYREYRDLASVCMFEQLLLRKTDKERMSLNDSILSRMEILWGNKEYFGSGFKGLGRMSTLISEDKRVKVCTWNIPMENSSNKFFGAVIIKDDKGDVKYFVLNDASDKMRSPEKAVLSPRKWYGAVYYDIVPVKDRNYGTYYMLLGYKPNNEMTKKKVVEPLIVISNTTPKFGHSVFQRERVVDKRLVFEYGANNNMMLKYDKHNKRFVFDHLSPSSPLFKGNFRLYGPDFSYDSYEFEKGKWVLYKDVDLRNAALE